MDRRLDAARQHLSPVRFNLYKTVYDSETISNRELRARGFNSQAIADLLHNDLLELVGTEAFKDTRGRELETPVYRVTEKIPDGPARSVYRKMREKARAKGQPSAKRDSMRLLRLENTKLRMENFALRNQLVEAGLTPVKAGANGEEG